MAFTEQQILALGYTRQLDGTYAKNPSPRNPGPTSKLEPAPRNEPLATPQTQGHHCQRFLVRVTSIRKRLLDEDNLAEKFHVDLCRYAGIIPGDEADKTRIETSQRKAEKGEEERTVIEVTLEAAKN
jgi:hypothetical protein